MIFLNALRGVRARVTMPKGGAWWVDVDVDLAEVPVAPTGRATLAIGVTPLIGTIDDRASGRFGTKAHVRLVAGGAGWDKPIVGVSHDNDAGVFSTEVYSVAAAAVGETVVELTPPKRLGVHYARMKGAASSVFAGVDWWVDLVGVTHVGPRLPLPLPPDAEILSWNAATRVAEIASDIVIQPGMVLVDPLRFGTAVVDDVEQTFEEGGSRAIAFCSIPDDTVKAASPLAADPAAGGGKLVKALAELARRAVKADLLARYAYRVVTQNPVDGRVTLQAVDPLAAAPPFLKLTDIWAGIAGFSVKLTPGSVVEVVFRDRIARVVGFDPKAPPALEVKLDAVRVVAGSTGAHPVALADVVAQCFAAVAANAGLTTATMTAALAPLLPQLASTKLFTDGGP